MGAHRAILLLVAALLLAPAALAGHEGTYTAEGIAARDALYHARLDAAGTPLQFALTITDLDGNLVAQATFAGAASFSGPSAGGVTLLQYEAHATQAGVDFHVAGLIVSQGALGVRAIALAGHYEDYQLALASPV